MFFTSLMNENLFSLLIYLESVYIVVSIYYNKATQNEVQFILQLTHSTDKVMLQRTGADFNDLGVILFYARLIIKPLCMFSFTVVIHF